MQRPSTSLPLRRNPTFLAMIAFGLIGLLVLATGLGLYLYFEPAGQTTHAAVTVTGIEQWDPHTETVSGRSQTEFSSSQIPAAVVDWSGISPHMEVEAGWYDESLSDAAALHLTGPRLASRMPTAIPLVTNRDALAPGIYLFIVGRFSGGRIVEVLARQEAQVT